jgi:radical SAM-linked protein
LVQKAPKKVEKYVFGAVRTGKKLIKATNDTILVLLKFRIWGNLRFLSHAETMKVFQRACVRGGVEVAHSEGFNPHPRMSLPLPRSVGVESDDELVAFVVAGEGDGGAVEELARQIRARLADQLPEGCEVINASAVRGGKSPLPSSASYILPIVPEYSGKDLKNRIEEVLASESLIVSRRAGRKSSRPRDVDVRGFVKSIELNDGCVSVECAISSSGSIRMEEILDILGLGPGMLAGPIRRTAVAWRN